MLPSGKPWEEKCSRSRVDVRSHCDLNSCPRSFSDSSWGYNREGIRESRKCKKITHLIECLLLDPNTVFPQCLPPSPSPDGNEGFKNKILSSNCSLPEDVCWTIFSSLSQTFGILQAGREKPPGTTFLKGPLSLPCSPELLQLPPLDAAHLWAVEKEYWPSAFKSCQKSWSLPTTATEHL